jgi:hypothetical protein
VGAAVHDVLPGPRAGLEPADRGDGLGDRRGGDITATIPGLLLLTGGWDDVPDLLAVGVAVVAVALFAVIGARTSSAATESAARS